MRYVSSREAPDTVLMTFKVVHGQRAVIDGDLSDDQDTGRSPVSRWLAWAFDYDDFVSYTGTTTGICRLQLPRNTIGMELFVRVDTVFADATVGADVDIGDGNQPAGWGDSMDLSTATGIQCDKSALYNDWDADPADGAAGWQFYDAADTIDVIWNSVTLPTAGEAIVFLKCVSYHEELSSEWD